MVVYLYNQHIGPINYYNIIFFLIINFLIFNTILMYSMKNPVYSLVLLIQNYLIVGGLFIYNSFEFVGLIFMLVYVGAVSILLIFTIMLLNLRTIYYKSRRVYNIYSIFILIFFAQLFFLFINSNVIKTFVHKNYIDWFNIMFLKADVVNISAELYINNFDLIIIVAVLLTFILVASTNSVDDFKSSKKQELHEQAKKTHKIIVN